MIEIIGLIVAIVVVRLLINRASNKGYNQGQHDARLTRDKQESDYKKLTK